MGAVARQRFELALRAAEREFRALALIHVDAGADQSIAAPIRGRADDVGAVAYPAPAAAQGPHPILRLVTLAQSGDVRVELAPCQSKIVGMHQVSPALTVVLALAGVDVVVLAPLVQPAYSVGGEVPLVSAEIGGPHR